MVVVCVPCVVIVLVVRGGRVAFIYPVPCDLELAAYLPSSALSLPPLPSHLSLQLFPSTCPSLPPYMSRQLPVFSYLIIPVLPTFFLPCFSLSPSSLPLSLSPCFLILFLVPPFTVSFPPSFPPSFRG